MRPGLLAAIAVLAAACGRAPAAPAPPPRYTLAIEPADPALAPAITGHADAAVARIEAFFGAPFARAFTFRVFGDRALLDAHWGAAWKQPELHTECWMIGMGMGDELSILSPARWRDQACDHDPGDPHELADLITHELVHTYHAQRNPLLDADAAAAEAMAWFVEGVAVFASGQLERERLATAAEAIREGAAPARLADAWSGKYRYGVSGSLVGYVDATWGRATVVTMLAARTPAELLAPLGVDEPTLLARWQAWAAAR